MTQKFAPKNYCAKKWFWHITQVFPEHVMESISFNFLLYNYSFIPRLFGWDYCRLTSRVMTSRFHNGPLGFILSNATNCNTVASKWVWAIYNTATLSKYSGSCANPSTSLILFPGHAQWERALFRNIDVNRSALLPEEATFAITLSSLHNRSTSMHCV